MYRKLHGIGRRAKQKDMVWGPDNFYVATLDDVEIGKGEELPTLEVRPKSVVTTYTLFNKDRGAEKCLHRSWAVFPEWLNVTT